MLIDLVNFMVVVIEIFVLRNQSYSVSTIAYDVCVMQ